MALTSAENHFNVHIIIPSSSPNDMTSSRLFLVKKQLIRRVQHE